MVLWYLNPQWGVAAGVQKTILKNKGNDSFQYHRYLLDQFAKSSDHLR